MTGERDWKVPRRLKACPTTNQQLAGVFRTTPIPDQPPSNEKCGAGVPARSRLSAAPNPRAPSLWKIDGLQSVFRTTQIRKTGGKAAGPTIYW
jgi:hypothetical protein